jgi:hypothetical protein
VFLPVKRKYPIKPPAIKAQWLFVMLSGGCPATGIGYAAKRDAGDDADRCPNCEPKNCFSVHAATFPQTAKMFNL